MANEKNLKPFKKGQSGNPKGRPKKLPELEKLLEDTLGKEDRDGKTEAEKILANLVHIAKLKGEKSQSAAIRAAEVLMARGYGLPTTKVDVTSQGEKLTNSLIIVEKPPGEGSEPDPD